MILPCLTNHELSFEEISQRLTRLLDRFLYGQGHLIGWNATYPNRRNYHLGPPRGARHPIACAQVPHVFQVEHAGSKWDICNRDLWLLCIQKYEELKGTSKTFRLCYLRRIAKTGTASSRNIDGSYCIT